MKRIALAFAAMGMAALVLAQKAPTLKVGDPAPAMKVAKWVKGTPITQFAKGKVYVVEFWATWCGPCKVSIPHLTDMAHTFKGKVTFAGISVFERGNNIEGMVANFVKDMGSKMDYNVALDAGKTMAETWMIAAGQNGIPTAFVVGKEGKIDWIGHPMGGLDQVLTQIVAGKFDPKAAAAEREKAEAEKTRIGTLLAPVNAAANKGDWKGAVDELDKVFASNPELEKQFAPGKINLLTRAGEDAKVFAYAKQLGDGLYKDDAPMLNQVAWMLVNDQLPLKTRDYNVALGLAQRASDLTKDQDPTVLDTLATVHFKLGNVDKAIAVQTKAVDLAAKPDSKVNPQIKDEMAKRLAEFKAKKTG